MAQLKLHAKLRAYSKSPFYDDYVRGVNVNDDGTVESLEDNFLYGLRNGRWEKIFEGDMSEISDKLKALEEKDVSIEEKQAEQQEIILTYLNNIDLKFDADYNSLVWKGISGVPTYIPLQIQVDNETIYFDDNNRLSTVNKIDNKTIKITDINKLLVEGVYTYTDSNGIKHYITGLDLVSIEGSINNLNVAVDELQSNANGTGVSLSTLRIDLSYIYSHYENGEFPESTLLANIQTNLSDFAYESLGISAEVDKIQRLPQGMKIVDIYTGILYVWDKDSLMWIDKGKFLSVDATNTGIRGDVCGVRWSFDDSDKFDDNWEDDDAYLKISIDNDVVEEFAAGKHYSVDKSIAPTMSVNGLKQRLNDLDETKVEVYDNSLGELDVAYIQTHGDSSTSDVIGISTDSDASTIVKRSAQGTIASQDPINSLDVVTLGWLLNYFNDLSNAIEQVTEQSPQQNYNTSFIDNKDDITTVDGYENR